MARDFVGNSQSEPHALVLSMPSLPAITLNSQAGTASLSLCVNEQ